MTRRIPTAIAIGVAMAALVLVPSTALAKKKRRPMFQQYAVPFTCGLNDSENARAEPGDYAVAIDVRNAGDVDVTMNSTVSLSFPPGGLAAGPVSNARQDSLLVGESIQVSCGELLGDTYDYQGAPPASAYIQGFLVIEALGDLDVSRTQTAKGATGEVSVDTDVVRARNVSHKTLICHGNKTISVATAAWRAHQAHGDTVGACE